MIECPFCHKMIDGKTDDYYNITHEKIKCPYCGEWHYLKAELEREE